MAKNWSVGISVGIYNPSLSTFELWLIIFDGIIINFTDVLNCTFVHAHDLRKIQYAYMRSPIYKEYNIRF